MTTNAAFPLNDSPAVLAATVNAWLDEHVPDTWAEQVRSGVLADTDTIRNEPQIYQQFRSLLGSVGLATPAWPVEHGGLGLTGAAAAAVDEALLCWHCHRSEPEFVSLELAGRTILQWGTAQQHERYLPPLRMGAERWCQLFSEPGAGSDLASLSTTARQTDTGWVIDGQKVWNSFAHVAEFGILLARTDPSVPKHHGISYFLLDMRLPGVTVRPLRQMTGDAEFNEVFFDSVEIPTDALLGPLNGGWKVAISTLMAERSGITGRPTVGPGRATALARRARDTGAWDDPVLRDRLVSLFVAERAFQTLTIRAFEESRDRPPGAEGSMRKLRTAELDEIAGVLAADLDPLEAVAWEADAPLPPAVHRFLSMKTLSIAGGTSEIQRNIIGERVLGLPKDVDPDRNVPFDQRARG